ncbi:helix-turn-helix domain-containing protein [Deinococcus sp. KNUC1210]|uniref:DNA-3-methyladenine glycosylase 2 n=1 Tax=Deinococcus sp. KNUC1210 TaxID=2917691 RepID=UPI001EF012E8|nr:Ada metal-binding domain-containing protein [Deinococcus sp. KNUC1210]ULH14926.1 helix-turn-helix domain-containing protein [Deinococcus sp. KNUC1210]
MPWPLPKEFMLTAMLTADASCDGSFITGVVSTGIYCLPSCRARKPRPENVVFYQTPVQARAAGLRACLRCRPDDFERGIDPQEQQLEAVLSGLEVREVPTAAALARRLDVGTSKLHALFRQYLQTTPAEWLNRRRVAQVRRHLLTTPHSVGHLAFEAGFESLSAFGMQFRRLCAMTPQGLRALSPGQPFELSLPPGYPVEAMLRELGRDVQQTTARTAGTRWTGVLHLSSRPALVRLEFEARRVRAEVVPTADWTPADSLALHTALLRLLGLSTDPRPFETQLPPHLAALIAGQSGLRPSLVPGEFDGLVWAILGQQVRFQTACLFRRRLLERLSQPVLEGLYAPPQATQILTLSVADLRGVGLTCARAELLLRVAALVADGSLDLTRLARGTATGAERTLRAIPGIGPWTARYVLLRVLGFADVVPLNDSALAGELQRFFDLPRLPGARQQEVLLAPFAPFRSLATLHFWHRAARRNHAPSHHESTREEFS